MTLHSFCVCEEVQRGKELFHTAILLKFNFFSKSEHLQAWKRTPFQKAFSSELFANLNHISSETYCYMWYKEDYRKTHQPFIVETVVKPDLCWTHSRTGLINLCDQYDPSFLAFCYRAEPAFCCLLVRQVFKRSHVNLLFWLSCYSYVHVTIFFTRNHSHTSHNGSDKLAIDICWSKGVLFYIDEKFGRYMKDEIF